MENQNTLMGELLSVLKESLHKQAFSVILLFCVCVFLWFLRASDKSDLSARILFLTGQIEICSKARESAKKDAITLTIEVKMLRERTDILAGIISRRR